MHLLLILLACIAVVFAVLAVIVALQPAGFRIVRSTTVSVPPARVFAEVNDLRRWEEWSPWAKLDPGMKQTYDGHPSGVGSIAVWSGNREVGEGRMTITECTADERVRIRLEFFKPFKATNEANLGFRSTGDETLVTWEMTGTNNFAAKAAHLLLNIDRKVGGDFEKGLARLKSIAESAT